MNRGFSKQLSQTDEVYGKGFNERLVQVLICKENITIFDYRIKVTFGSIEQAWEKTRAMVRS